MGACEVGDGCVRRLETDEALGLLTSSAVRCGPSEWLWKEDRYVVELGGGLAIQGLF